MNAAKTPIDLRAVVKTRLDQLTFVKPLRLKDVTNRDCAALGEGTSADYTQGVRLNDAVAIFLDHWGWGLPHNRYSFAVFEQADGHWQQVRSRIDDINKAVALAIHALTERDLLEAI